MRIHFNDGWYFTPNYDDSLPFFTRNQAEGLEAVRLPHTVKDLPFNYPDETAYKIVSGYLHPLFAPKDWQGKAVLLTFGAASHEATVFCNGTPLLTHRCGYTAFTVELSKHLHYGEENMIAVRLDIWETLDRNVIDYLPCGGLYRTVTLDIKEQTRIENVFIHGTAEGRAELSITAHNTTGCTISAQILHKGKVIAQISEQDFARRFRFRIPNPPLWDPDCPELCQLKIFLCIDGIVKDTYETRFGFRTIDFRSDGLYVNGVKRKLRGLNRHQSWPYMGYAATDRAQALDADILKNELGCNCVRTGHYPQSHAFLDRCDELGLLVFAEIPRWQHIGGEQWKEIAVENVREMVVQYRNHPSICTWGIQTNELAHRLDPTRPTGGVRNFKKSHLYEDFCTYNDFPRSADWMCCHGVVDVFRNPKLAAAVYASQGFKTPVLEIIGDHSAGCAGKIYAFTNADTVELYKNDEYVATFAPGKKYSNFPHPPIVIDDTIGCLLETNEGLDAQTANAIKKCLRAVATHGWAALPPKYSVLMRLVMAKSGLNDQDCVNLYEKYAANWGSKMTTWRFVAKQNSMEVACVTRGPVRSVHLSVRSDTQILVEKGTWDMATIRFAAMDNYGNVLPYCNRVVSIEAEGPLDIVGPRQIALSGGMGGTYLKTIGYPGEASVTITCQGMEPVRLIFQISVQEDESPLQSEIMSKSR